MPPDDKFSPTRRHLLTGALGAVAALAAGSAATSPVGQLERPQPGYPHAPGGLVVFGDDGTDVAAFVNAMARIAAMGGGTLMFRRGVYNWPSTDLKALGHPGITVPANCTIDGNGSVINITGSDQIYYVFTATDVSRVAVADLKVIGNSVSTGYNGGAFMKFALSPTATAGIDSFKLDTVELQNFKAPWWILVYNESRSNLEIQHVRINGLRGISRPGNSLDPEDLGAHAAVIGINSAAWEPDDAARAIVRDVIVTGFYAEATHIKQGINFESNVRDSEIRGAVVHNAGLVGGKDDTGCYALMVYGANNRNIRITDPVLISPRDNGIYAVNGSGLAITNATVRGQTSNSDWTLPKAGISINSVRDATVSGGTFSNNVTDLYLGIRGTAANVSVEGVECNGASRAGIWLQGSAANVGGATITGARVNAGDTARALYSPNDDIHYVNEVRISDCEFATRYITAVEVSASPTPAANWSFSNVTCTARGTPFQAYQFGGQMTIKGMRLVLSDGGTEGYSAFRCYGAGAMIVDGLTIAGQRVGTTLDTRRFVGSLINVRSENSTTRPLSASEGTSRPTFKGFPGARIQNLTPEADGYHEWQWQGGAWVESR
ncbi:right-handed parallel beta-helix repeat-containing protein [Mesorhizobium sp.]|uniref:right-handed parallel beta-helix repeat-containing protein n=1 Tax=Mesorhizobium sp. TaxID=1871066 RepID=UPI000FE32795|nr:right-handed parallel beta-helix repeat-containing protein [Mesorhizobium sp.]RWN58263.1 MAG: right-handed parallel beta-helix repeat-containing protein [Mesorhizobium sp.]RWN79267.1 MAG: right-handed parallel beta-helix repeat-containing protein [Mesorhizobium sp.]RWN84824.1 MAG: right-handed parallel beta-helix repeat-containing protein [Mesorhizobium sp.]RWN92943.1 MAG: right-handed parallel beta-helix repeat-containing protein [Mesorhizobium sp.]RWO17255.1 MAG: right-handed parallel bet